MAAPYVPNYAQEGVYWQPRLNPIIDIVNRCRQISERDLTEEQAKTESFARVDLINHIKEMDANPARRSDYYRTKCIYILARLGRSTDVMNEHLTDAEGKFRQLKASYGNQCDGPISVLGKNLEELRQQLDKEGEAGEEEENDAEPGRIDHYTDQEEENIQIGYSGYGNHIDKQGEHP
ncbi:hypothetical protein FKW77_005897 [Venturia effusa]|uniref:Uncharacterized protein n=1 Tax=Venturia effusa TaxID=50376 RepID=A0A517LQ85_9PEZI|nr:hypothetical protein FKW77_005897 [Venturia effusa]